MVFGTFDILHPGHSHFFRQARALAKQPRLIVSVARDANAQRIKGAKPWNHEQRRLAQVKAHWLVDKAVLGSRRGYLAHIMREEPAIIALGYDQQAYTAGLAARLRRYGLTVKIVRLKAHQPQKYKSAHYKQHGQKS